MNKIKIIMPAILVAPILFGCNQNKSTYSFTFHSDYCNLDNKSEYSKKETEPITLNMTLKEEYGYCAMPDDIIVLIGKEEGVKGQHYEYTPIIEAGEKYAKSATLTLVVSANISVTAKFSDSDNAFRINPNKFDEAVNLTNEKYVQRAYMYMIESFIHNIIYQEDYTSPSVYNSYQRRLESSSKYEPSEKYVEKKGDKYYSYNRKTASSPWQKEDAKETEFINASDLSIKHLIELGDITYEKIKDCYVEDTQSYEFTTTSTKGGDYEVILSFYNNKVTFLSYYRGDATSYDDFGMISFTYREITPTLPKVN